MNLDTVHEIERAIDALSPQKLAELYAWLDRNRSPQVPSGPAEVAVFEQGLGLFGSPDDAVLLDEVVHIAYEERHRPSRPFPAL